MPLQKAIAKPIGQTTEIVDLTQAEIDARAVEDAAFNAGADDRKAKAERAWRDAELKSTDYTQLGDDPTGNAAGYATYRQELRDMPTLTGFPNTHTRPTPPA